MPKTRTRIDVVVEAGSKRAIASALAWPGWARGGKTEAEAIATLVAYAPRYERIAKRFGFEPP